jgi:hypothetical protein
MTKEAVHEIEKKYLQMKAQGVSQGVRARRILRGIQQKTELLKREQARRQQQLKAQQEAALLRNAVAPAQHKPGCYCLRFKNAISTAHYRRRWHSSARAIINSMYLS